MDYKNKYLKYKNKYLNLKGGGLLQETLSKHGITELNKEIPQELFKSLTWEKLLLITQDPKLMNNVIDNFFYENNKTKLKQYLQKHVNLADKLPIYLLKSFDESYVFHSITILKPQIWEKLLSFNLTNDCYDSLIKDYIDPYFTSLKKSQVMQRIPEPDPDPDLMNNVIYENNKTKLKQYLETRVNLADKLPIDLLDKFSVSYVFKVIPLIKSKIWENLLKVDLTNKDYDLLIEDYIDPYFTSLKK